VTARARQIVRLGRPASERRRGFTLTPGAIGASAAHPDTPQAGAALWAPFPGSPQEAAYHSPADWIGYGGAGGGGKTDLGLGLAGTQHRRSLILRRVYKSLAGTVDRSRAIYNAGGAGAAADSYNEGLHRWKLASGRLIQFGSVEHEKSKEDWRGNPFDFYDFDEATQFTESMVRFITAWNRTDVPGQRCRVLLAFNPPTDEAGRWVIRFFLPWMTYLYPGLPECQAYTGTPARPGELRWFTTIDGRDVEVPAGTKGAKSRTYFPARVEDNPVYMAQGYDATLDALPEPLRSQMRHGDFAAGIESNPWQIVPRPWAAAARARWREDGKAGPCSGVGLDVARGGRDQTVAARLYGAWVAPLQAVPGVQTATGPQAAALILPDVAAGAPAGVDVIGVGASAFDFLSEQGNVAAVNFSAAAKDPITEQPFLDRTKKLRFFNLRAYGYWLLREALDPEGANELALPPDDQLITEICTPRWSLTSRGIQVESKEDVIARVGHSPDRADALVIALLAPLLARQPEVRMRWL
jgi:hypothetical protein